MSSGLPPEVFRAEPLVLGYLGDRDTDRWASAISTSGGELRPRYESERFGLAGSRAGLEVVRNGRAWCWGRRIAGRRRPRSRTEAAHDLGLAGLWITDQGAELHTDLFGMNDLYLRRIGQTTYFSNRLQPLVALGGSLGIDWDGWGASLAFQGFVGRSTPFREIRRMGFGEVLNVDAGGVTSGKALPEWLVREPKTRTDSNQILAELKDALPSRFIPRRLQLTLSGGWDSRLIAAMLRANGRRRVAAWTIDPDSGYVDDVEYARAVARELQLPHTVVPTSESAWLDDRAPLLARVEHQTWLHTWLYPLAARLHASRGTVVDGLGGDVLLKNLFISDEMLASSPPDARALLLQALTGNRLHNGCLLPQVAARWQEAIENELAPPDDPFQGHPRELMLRILTVRTNRVIASSPFRVFGPEARVLTPFMTPAVVRAVLDVPLDAKQDHSFYRSAIGAINQRVAMLPSTNDGPLTLRSTEPSRQASQDAVSFMRSQVLQCAPLRTVLAPEFTTVLSRPDSPELFAHLDFLQWASAFADWHAVHADVLRQTSAGSARIEQSLAADA